MGRKSKQPGGHGPLTHYERTRKFASSEHGTIERRLAGHSQYQMGQCALTSQTLYDGLGEADAATTTTTATRVLCTPSGYLYAPDALLDYLLHKTAAVRSDQAKSVADAKDRIRAVEAAKHAARQRTVTDFERQQRETTTTTSTTSNEDKAKAVQGLAHMSYWLPSSQPPAQNGTKRNAATAVTSSNNHGNSTALVVAVVKAEDNLPAMVSTTEQKNAGVETTTDPPPPPSRPTSPISGEPLARKDAWPVTLAWERHGTAGTKRPHGTPQLVCAVSDQPIKGGAPCVAYWTTERPSKLASSSSHRAGTVVRQDVYDKLIVGAGTTQDGNHHHNHNKRTKSKSTPSLRCPLTDRKIRHTRVLQTSGSSYAGSSQVSQVKRYRPTIT